MRQNRTPTAASEVLLRQLLEQTQAEKQALTEQLQEAQELLRRALTEPKTAEPSQPARPGYLVITPSPYFDGESMGVRFERGQAFLPKDDPDSAGLARRLADELGYSVLYLDDYTGPFERPDVSARPIVYPPAPSARSEAREMFGGYL